jgi:hypothetical protein
MRRSSSILLAAIAASAVAGCARTDAITAPAGVPPRLNATRATGGTTATTSSDTTTHAAPPTDPGAVPSGGFIGSGA